MRIDFSDFSVSRKSKLKWQEEILSFLDVFKDNSKAFIEVSTSGSSGKPKKIKLKKLIDKNPIKKIFNQAFNECSLVLQIYLDPAIP